MGKVKDNLLTHPYEIPCPVDADGIPFTPTGDIVATNIQDAIEELDDEKLPKVITKLQLDHNVETLAANKTLVVTDMVIQKLDPDGTDRNVLLPAEGDSTDLVFLIYNMGGELGEDLYVQNDAAGALNTVGFDQMGIFTCDGTTWVGSVSCCNGAPTVLNLRGKEENTSAIVTGQPVYISGGTGAAFGNFGLADCDDSAKIRVKGLAAEDISQNATGYIRIKGLLEDVNSTKGGVVNPNSEDWVAGDQLYVSRTAGGLTNVRPTSGRHIKAGTALTTEGANSKILVDIRENPVRLTAASGEDIVLRMGDNNGTNKVSLRDYANNEVASVDSDGKGGVTGLISTAPAKVESFTGTISAATRTATFSETADYSLCKVGSTLIADGDTRIVIALLGSDQVTLDANTTWAASTAITSLQDPISQEKDADGTVVKYVNALGGVGLLGGTTWNRGLTFGDSKYGFYRTATNKLQVVTTENSYWVFDNAVFGGTIHAGGATIKDSGFSTTVPQHTFTTYTGTGVGIAATDQLSLIAGGVEGQRIIEANSLIYHLLGVTQQDSITDATTNGTTTITKTGENFSTTCQAGDAVLIYGGTTVADYGFYQIATVTDDTHLVLDRAPSGSDSDVDFYVLRNGSMMDGSIQIGDGAGRIVLSETTAPSAITDHGFLYNLDYTGTSKPTAMDDAGGAAALTPHGDFEDWGITPPSIDYPWLQTFSQYALGIEVAYDIDTLIADVKAITGKTYRYQRNMDANKKIDLVKTRRDAWKAQWIKDNITEVEVIKTAALEDYTESVADDTTQIGEDITYSLGDDGEVTETKTPKYKMKTIQKKRVKDNVRFDETTGKFFEKSIPTQVQAEAAVVKDYIAEPLPKYLKDRL